MPILFFFFQAFLEILSKDFYKILYFFLGKELLKKNIKRSWLEMKELITKKK